MTHFKFNGKWRRDYRFDAFKGLQSRRGSYTSASSNEVSDGTVSLIINDDTSENPDPDKEQIEALNFIIDNPSLILNTLRKGIASIYEDLKIRYEYEGDDEGSQERFPPITELSDYDNVFGVGNIFVQLPS
jgi:hypothetical protein